MAVIAQGPALRRMLEQAEQAQQAAGQAAEARQAAEQAAEAVAAAMEQAAGQADPDSAVPAAAAAAVGQAAGLGRAGSAGRPGRQRGGPAGAGRRRARHPRRGPRRGRARRRAGTRGSRADDAAWGVGPGELQRMPFEQRARLAERLRTGRLGRFADLIGRFRRMAAGQLGPQDRGRPRRAGRHHPRRRPGAGSSPPSTRSSACPRCAPRSPPATPNSGCSSTKPTRRTGHRPGRDHLLR